MKPIPNYPDYEISEDGRVFRVTSRTRGRVGDEAKVGIMNSGYAFVNLSRLGSKPRKFSVQSLILEAFVGPRPSPSHQAAHINGNKLDNRLENLMWATPKENSSHKKLHGTQLVGESMYNSKLTEETISEILRLRGNGESACSIAKTFGISDSLIYRIEKGVAWKHLNLPVRGKMIRGSSHHKTHLTDSDVLDIRKRYTEGETQRSIAKRFGVHFSNINAIIKRKTWKHI